MNNKIEHATDVNEIHEVVQETELHSEEKLNPVESLAQYYASHPNLQALSQFLPGGSRLVTLLKLQAEGMSKARAKAFFDALEQGGVYLNEEVVASDEFVHRFVITAKAAANTYRHDKIRRFARLFESSFKEGAVTGTDEYEEFLQIIEEMSDREYLLLSILEKHEKETPLSDDISKMGDHRDPQEFKEITRAEMLWPHFVEEAEARLGITKDQIKDMLSRLVRTGCYQPLIAHLFFDQVRDEGKLTTTWFRIQELVDRLTFSPESSR